MTKRDTLKEWKSTELAQAVRGALASGKSVARILVEQNLFLEVRQRTKTASWVFRYTYGGKKTSMGFGRWAEGGGVGLAEARKKAAKAREQLTQGQNPVGVKRAGLMAAAVQHGRIVDKAIEEWLKVSIQKLTSPKYIEQKRRRLFEVTAYRDSATKVRKLGDMPVADVSTAHVKSSIDVLVQRGALETARRVLWDLEKAFDWARGAGWRDAANPCPGVETTFSMPEKLGHRAPNIAELGEVVRGLMAAQGTGLGLKFDYDTRLARLLLLTAARTGEIRLARWDEVIDLDGDTPRIEVPESRMKKRKPWTCVLSSQSVTILKELRENAAQWGDESSPLIFMKYRKSGRGVVSNENAVNAVLKRAGLHEKIVGHGFRKLFSTAAHSSWPYSGNNREKAIEHSLAHANTQTVEHIYNKAEFLTERALLAQWWADHCDMVAAGERGTVVEFKKSVAT